MWRTYYRLAKPGIVYGNLVTVVAGYLFASHLHIRPSVLIAVCVGMALVMASACVLNNIIDKDIDRMMSRTKDRALVTGTVSTRQALLYGVVVGLLGVMTLLFHTNLLTAVVAGMGFVAYVFVYSLSKRITRAHTLIGSISGAVPILAGYTAYTNTIDTAGIILFFILVLWQMPHFYSIALYRLQEYAAAGIPLLPSVKGAYLTKVIMVVYIIAFTAAETTLTILGYTGYFYLIIVLAFGASWTLRAIAGFRTGDDAAWARKLFFFSLEVLVAFCVGISLGTVLT